MTLTKQLTSCAGKTIYLVAHWGLGISPAIRIACYFVFWCWLITWLVDSGTLWDALRGRLAEVEQYQAQDVLIRGTHNLDRDVLLIGDPLFLDRTRPELSSDFTTMEIPIRSIDAFDVAKALRMTRRKMPGARTGYSFRSVIIQVSPHYFSNVMQRGVWDNYDYWKTMTTKKQHPYLPNGATGIFFSTLKAWSATTGTSSASVTNRPPPLEQRFIHVPAPRHWGILEAAISVLKTPTILVPDLRNMDFSGAPEVLDEFETNVKHAVVSSRRIKPYVIWSEFASLNQILRKTVAKQTGKPGNKNRERSGARKSAFPR